MDLIADRRMGRTGKARMSAVSPDGRPLAVSRAGHRDPGVCKHGPVDELQSSVELVPTLSLSAHTHAHTLTHMDTPHTHEHTRTYMHARTHTHTHTHTHKLPGDPSRVPSWPRALTPRPALSARFLNKAINITQ